MPYAVVVGEALVDLFEETCDGESVYRPMVGGAPLNVASGLARLGSVVEFIGSVGGDALGARIWHHLRDQGIGIRGCLLVDAPTTLAVTSLSLGVPEFSFYGDPPSFSLYGPEHLDQIMLRGAASVYCGSIALLYRRTLATARAAWATPGPMKVFDPNVRPRLMGDPAALRAVVEEFAATADLVKLSEADAHHLYGLAAEPTAAHLRNVGAAAVVVTLGERGAYANVADGHFSVSAPPVEAIDTTGAGDAAMAGLMHALMVQGSPKDVDQWRQAVEFAVLVASLACQTRGAATAMPTTDQLPDWPGVMRPEPGPGPASANR